MSRYIDAENLPRHGQRGGVVHWKDIETAPSIDIVFCRECIWFDTDNLGEDYCTYGKGLADAKADDFCSHGEREE